MSKAENWSLGDLEPATRDLQASIGVLRHLSQSPSVVTPDQWVAAIGAASSHADILERLWKSAWDESSNMEVAHKAEIEALRAAKAAPGSDEDVEKVSAARWLLFGAAKVVLGQLGPLEKLAKHRGKVPAAGDPT